MVYTSKRGTVSYEPLDWLAAITSHIPDKGAQNVRHYGIYSNKSRGIQKKSEQMVSGELVIADSIPSKKSCSKTWAALIKKVYEVDPLVCPRCLHHMRIISIIKQPEIIEKILKHCDLWQPQAHGPPMIGVSPSPVYHPPLHHLLISTLIFALTKIENPGYNSAQKSNCLSVISISYQ